MRGIVIRTRRSLVLAEPSRDDVAMRLPKGGGADAEKKPLVRKPRTNEDLRELKAHSKAKTPVSRVAKLTEGAVRQKAATIGIGLGH